MNGILSLVLSVAVLINNDWTFSLGSGEGMREDFMHGTEYFTYVAKARSNNHNFGPIMPEFDDSSWQKVSLPHDWVVDLPFSGDASHSHGYKCIGWKYPQNSVGWYRKHLQIPAEWKGRSVRVAFDGIFRDSQVYINGFYLGGRNDGYLQQYYDITDYLDYGSDNVLTVRCDASLEEGWFYEGAGIYRNVYLHVSPRQSVLPYGVKTVQSYDVSDSSYTLDVSLSLSQPTWGCSIVNELLDAEGNVVASGSGCLKVKKPSEWSPAHPYLYTLRTVVTSESSDTTLTRIGFRRVEFFPEEGFLLNGEKFVLKGCNLHQDHAGVGAGIPDGLWRYRLEQLRKYGFNAIRSSHNPATPAMLDLCDEMGFIVIDENREFGSSARQLGNLADMIQRDINHPSIVLWSVGNEEWALEWSEKGRVIAERMCAHARSIDPSRLCTYGNSGGRELVKGSDVFGYNYIVQNPVEEYHASFPGKTAVGTEETSGAGTRGEYATVPEKGWMQPLNRRDTLGVVNAIERGWKFYHSNRWTGGLFYWTGFDYRGESNPMVWPATGSQFGILDYCGFPKDEAFYLKAWWNPDEPVIHVCGLSDGEVWVYSNCREVELFAGRRSLGRKEMPLDGHLSWTVGDVTEGTVFTARGRSGSRSVSACWPEKVKGTSVHMSKPCLVSDGQDVIVVDVDSDAEILYAAVEGAVLLGWGNGDPGFKEKERPSEGDCGIFVKPFNGKCQILIRSLAGSDAPATLTLGAQRFAILTSSRSNSSVDHAGMSGCLSEP